MELVFLGAPGAGKGTQADYVAEKLGIPTISTGNMLRAAVKNKTQIGLEAKKFMDSGKLVPDDVIIGIVAERLKEDDCKVGCILDGVPRTIAQAEAMEKFGVAVDAAVLIDVPDEVIEKRMSGRRTCHDCGAYYHVEAKPPKQEGICDVCGCELEIRKDDLPETVRHRLEVYHQETEPLVDFYRSRGTLKVVAGTGAVDETTALVFKALGIE
jgi:adenylate kinase